MNADLMSPPGFQLDAEHGVIGEALRNAVVGHGGFAVRPHREAFAVEGVAADRFINGAAAGHGAVGQGEVFALHGSGLQLIHQLLVGLQGLRDHQQATGVLVDPVNNAAAWNVGQIRAVIEQAILQGAVPVAGSRMHDQPGGFVDDQEFLILMDDDQRDGLRLHRGRGRGLGGQRHSFATPDPMLGHSWRAVEQGRALANPDLKPASGKFGKQGAHGLIQSLARQFGRDHGGERLGGIHFSRSNQSSYTGNSRK